MDIFYLLIRLDKGRREDIYPTLNLSSVANHEKKNLN